VPGDDSTATEDDGELVVRAVAGAGGTVNGGSRDSGVGGPLNSGSGGGGDGRTPAGS